MNEADREKIKRNASKLMEIIDFEALKPFISESGIFPNDMLFDIEHAGTTDFDKSEVMLKYLPKRGPAAYKNFVKCLLDSGQTQAARTLENAIPDTGVWEGIVRQATSWPNTNKEVYKMFSKPRGVTLIISNTTFDTEAYDQRDGGEVDEINLRRLFESLGFEVDLCQNQTKGEIWKCLSNFQRDERHKRADACVIIVLSHGTTRGFVCSDNMEINNESIIKMFDNANCRLLHGKPKLFFFSHCRGSEVDYAIKNEYYLPDSKKEAQISGLKSLSTFSDMRICYSTCPSYISLRSPDSGTMFISYLVQVFSEHAHDTDLDTMLRLLASEMSGIEPFIGWKQTPEYAERGWRSLLYFNPGLYQ